MKKTVLTVVSAVLFFSFVFSGCKIPFLNINDKEPSADKVVALYADAVNKTKSKSNFKLDVTTVIALEAISSEAALLNDMLEIIMGYSVGDTESSTQSYAFSEKENNFETPLDIIQPAGSLIENYNADYVLNPLYSDEIGMLSFDVKGETAVLDKVMTAINPILKNQPVADNSEINALAPNHSSYINVGNILSTAIDMLGINELINGEKSGSSDASGDKTVRISGGSCSIDDMNITAEIDESGFLKSVNINAPVELNAVMLFMNNSINSTIRITVTQTYKFYE